MLTFTLNSPGSVRVQDGKNTLTIFADLPASPTDILVQSVPEEDPPKSVICWPGEYDTSGIMMRGIGQKEGQQVSFMIVLDGKRCAFIASPLLEWSDHDLEQLGDIDILVLPGEDPKLVQTIVDEVDPRVIILMPNKEGTLSPEALKACGAQDQEHVLDHKVKGLPSEGREVVVLG